MKRVFDWAGQALLYGGFAVFVGTFSQWPTYEPLAPDQALIKLSFVHHGQRVAECRPYTADELAKLAPNMRAPLKCERERAPVRVELDIDGVPAYQHVAEPSGLSRDGASTVYKRLEVPAGKHRITVRMRDTTATSGFTYQHDATVDLVPAQVLVIDFDAQRGEIILL
ncbi:MAG: hypothetical protein M9919_15005 [Burkholderiaceae bacterium]|jgi:hypothetical protein|nr:hypothetical protein [Burkholderiaceae bacterium]